MFIDRWSRRRILQWTPVVRAAMAVVTLLAGHASAALYGPAIVIVSLNRFYLTTASAVMPAVVPDEDLLVANSMAAATGTLVTFLGLLAATQAAHALGTGGLLALSAAGWLLSVWPITAIRDPLATSIPRAPAGEELRRVVPDTVDGARRLGATPPAVGGVATMTLDQLLFGVVTALSIVVFKREFSGGIASYGRIIGAGGLGVLIGTVTVGAFEPRWTRPRIVALAFALGGVVCLAASASITAPSVLFVSLTIGLIYPWKKVPVDTIVQEAIPDRYRGRAFALYDLGFALARVVGAVILAAVVDHASASLILAVVGAVSLVWTPVLPWWSRRPARVGLRFYAGARGQEVPREIVVGGRAEPVSVMGSWDEERSGVRVRRFRLRTRDAIVDVVGSGDGPWTVEHERRDARATEGETT